MPPLCRGTGSDELSAPLKKAYHLFDKTLGNAGVFRVAFLAATIFYYVNFYDRIFNPVNLVLSGLSMRSEVLIGDQDFR